MPSLVSCFKKIDDCPMIRVNLDSFWRRRRGQTWRLALGLGLWLTLVDIGTGAQNVSDDADILDAREPTPMAPHDADALSPASAVRALTGTILFAKSVDTRTIIADARGSQRVYALGDEIDDGGKVIEIHRDYIVLQRGGHLETLELSWNKVVRIFDRAARLTQDAAQETPPEDYPEVLRSSMFTHPELLLQLVGVTPDVEGERFRGFRVMKPEDPAFLESLGLKPGDVLTAVNGVPLNTPDYGTQLLDAMSGTGMLTFTIRRGGEILVLNY